MKTHELYARRKHLIEDHHWEPDRANAVVDTYEHDAAHAAGTNLGHTHDG